MNKKILDTRLPKKQIDMIQWGIWIAIAIFSAIGINMLFAGLGFLDADTGYQEAAESLYAVSISTGLLLYGVIMPLIEEVLFRGLIFQTMKKFCKPMYAALLSAAFFGIYHGNGVQLMYAFYMGCILAYAYHSVGNFMLPVMMHGIVNMIIFLASNFGWIDGSVLQLMIGMGLTGLSAVCFFKISKISS